MKLALKKSAALVALSAVVAISLLAAIALAGNKLPPGKTWTGTSSNGLYYTTVESSETGNMVTITRVPQGGGATIISYGVLNSAGTAYATASGEIEFDDVVDGNDKAYNYTFTRGTAVETGLVSLPQ